MTEETRVYLPAVLADNYGIPQEEAKRQMDVGEVFIDGHEVVGHNFWFHADALEGKSIEVRTAQKRYGFSYQPPSFRG